MKRILFCAASLAAIVSLASCEQSLPVNPMGGGNYLKTISVNLTDKLATKSDGEINDATVFVYQKTSSGDPVLYDRVYTDGGSSLSFELVFSNQVSYSYTVKAYANMGDLESEPVAGELKLKDEDPSALRLYGSASIGSSTTDVTLSLQRYVNKISVSTVNLVLPEFYASSTVVLKSIYLAKVSDAVSNGELLNSDGYHTATDEEPLVYRSFDMELDKGVKNAVGADLYSYGSSVTLMMACEINGVMSYYRSEISDMHSNTHYDYTLNVYQEGAATPFGSLPTLSYSVVRNTLSTADYTDKSGTATFGSNPNAGVGILAVDGTRYKLAAWYDAESAGTVTDSDVVGVFVTDGEHSFVIHPTAEQSDTKWSSNYSVAIDGVVTVTDRTAAEADFAGAANTAAILAAVEAGTIADAPAAQYAAGITFANGKSGYLPSAGELTLAYQHLTEINSCLEAIGGTKFDMEGKYYFSSTQYSANIAWYWGYYSKYVDYYYKSLNLPVRVFAAL